MRLIALAQNNMPYNAQSIENNNPIPPLAQFDLNNKQNNSYNSQMNNNLTTIIIIFMKYQIKKNHFSKIYLITKKNQIVKE